MAPAKAAGGLTRQQAILKRGFDILLSAAGLVAFGWLVAIGWLLASADTRSNGWFLQQRVGRNGQLFNVYKIKTMRDVPGGTTVTVAGDDRITPVGAVLRKLKLDELPQLLNVLLGDMSFVGPRPDVPGYADQLQGAERLLLSVRPGITGPASIKYRDEEELLAGQADPESFNREVIWPDKVRINLDYIRNWHLLTDIRYIWLTLL